MDLAGPTSQLHALPSEFPHCWMLGSSQKSREQTQLEWGPQAWAFAGAQ